jgi:hypothetical protein
MYPLHSSWVLNDCIRGCRALRSAADIVLQPGVLPSSKAGGPDADVPRGLPVPGVSWPAAPCANAGDAGSIGPAKATKGSCRSS